MMSSLKQTIQDSSSANRFKVLKTEELEREYISDLIDELAAIREDIGMFRRISEDRQWSEHTRQQAKTCLKSYTQYLHILKMEIESERLRKK